MQVKKAGLLTKILILALLIYMAIRLLDIRGQLAGVKAEQAELATQVTQMQQGNHELGYKVEHSDDPDVLEQVAREQGLVKPGEKVFIDITN